MIDHRARCWARGVKALSRPGAWRRWSLARIQDVEVPDVENVDELRREERGLMIRKQRIDDRSPSFSGVWTQPRNARRKYGDPSDIF